MPRREHLDGRFLELGLGLGSRSPPKNSPPKNSRLFFREEGGGSARAAHARSAALVAISNRRGGGGENWVGGVCGQKLKFVGFFGKPIFSRILRPFSRFIGSGPTPSPGISRAKRNAYPEIQILVPPAQRPSPPPGKPVTKPEKKNMRSWGSAAP